MDADVLVVGAGVFGLACAWAGLDRGMQVLVLEAETPGAGASGGLVGALAPHAPDHRWGARHRFQFEALLGAEAGWAAIAAAGGIDPGYARIGRLIPLPSAAARARAEAQAEAAHTAWRGAAAWSILEAAPLWVAPEAAAHGAVFETLSARVDPRRAVAALAAAVAARACEIRCGWRVDTVGAGEVAGPRGRVRARTVVLAGGAAGFALTPELPLAAVKGQAALLGAAAPPGAPLVYADGLWVAPRADGRVAVGATSELAWTDPHATDAGLDGVIEAARALCPALHAAPVVERWAGLRPRGRRPDPMLGPIPGWPGVLIAAGGFRIGFGIALAVGGAVAAMAAGETPDLPPGFLVAEHLAGRYPSTSGANQSEWRHIR